MNELRARIKPDIIQKERKGHCDMVGYMYIATFNNISVVWQWPVLAVEETIIITGVNLKPLTCCKPLTD